MKTNCILETQTLIDENTTDIFWGKAEDVEWLEVGDEIRLISLKEKKPRNLKRTKYDYIVEGYHHMKRESNAHYSEKTNYFKSLEPQVKALYRTIVNSIWSGGQNRGGVPQRHHLKLRCIRINNVPLERKFF